MKITYIPSNLFLLSFTRRRCTEETTTARRRSRERERGDVGVLQGTGGCDAGQGVVSQQLPDEIHAVGAQVRQAGRKI